MIYLQFFNPQIHNYILFDKEAKKEKWNSALLIRREFFLFTLLILTFTQYSPLLNVHQGVLFIFYECIG